MRKKSFEDTIEAELSALLQQRDGTKEEQIKLLNVAVRWAAVKAKIVLPEHGSAFDDE